MSVLLNVVALALVLASCWLAMAGMARWAHRKRRIVPGPGEPATDTCPECNGVGARRRLSRLEPCPVCEGRGVVTALPH